jgi:uncharacterized protein (DUF983 family)
MSGNNASSGGGGLFAVFVVFLVLKITGTVDWSWWLITIPLWLPVVITVTTLIVAALIGFAFGLGPFKRRRT